jgi:NAD+ kinase
MGRVGYMTELEMNELDLLEKIFTEDFYLDERAMLRVDIRSSKGKSRFSAYALNEAVIANGSTARIIDLELSNNGRLVSEYRADGLVIATPTGSTAYSLSAGRPIVDPKLSCFCVTPICPHSLVARPLVFPDSAILEIKNICVREKILHLTVDGKATFDLFLGDTVVVTKASIKTKLLRIKDDDFYYKIRMKKFI